MKKLFCLLVAAILTVSMSLTTFAANGEVVYDGKAKNFIFTPGSNFSPTDLFPNFKSVMPGDSITQKITVKNHKKNKVKVKIYLRSLGAHEDSVEFLSKLQLTVQKSEENNMAYMFDAAADQTAGLTDWVYLGLIYSGGEVNLDVVLTVPTELSNQYSQQVGYVDWEFKVEEFPLEPGDPAPPTGDNTGIFVIIAASVGIIAVAGLFVVIILLKKSKKKEE